MNISNFKFQIFGLILLSILAFRFYFFYSNQTQYADGQGISFETSLLSEPQIFGSQQIFTANLGSNQKIRITTSRFPELHYGDFVRIAGKVSNKNDRLLIYFPEIQIANKSSNIFQTSLKKINTFRQKIIMLFSETLPSPSSSLLLGIIFGIKEQMPKDFSDNLKTTGVFHVIAASGMNVTLIGGFISSFFAFFLKRQIAIVSSILGIIFYAVLAGLEASIIRASIMGIIVFSAQILGRQTLAVNGLFLAGFIMLGIAPSLLSDIGFQLSFAATAGILFIKPIFQKKPSSAKASKGKEGIGSNVVTTIAAQIATLPILLANFGIYSIYSILVNGLVLWTVPILMMVGGLGVVLGLILEPAGQFLIYLCYPLLLYFQTVVNIFGKMGGVIIIQSLPWQFSAGYYCLLACALIMYRKRQ